MILMPATVFAIINGKVVSIDSDTMYPFGDILKYTFQAGTDFDFYIRVPDWATTASGISINGKHSTPLKTTTSTPSYKVAISKGTTSIIVTLASEIRTVPKANNTIAIYHGALLYALDIEYTTTSHAADKWSSHEPIPASETDPRALDHELLPTSNWSVAIDASQLRFVSSSPANEKLANPIYARGAPPVAIYAAATAIEWPETKGTSDLPPVEPNVVGELYWAKLVPYGSAKLHMGELPTVSLAKLK